jgi:anti-anti-sigma factor
MPPVDTTAIYRKTIADSREYGRARFETRRLSASRLAIAVTGEVDAVNARQLGRYVEANTGISRQLVLDLRAVDFFGSQGFTALYYVSVHCARNDVDWIILGSRPVRRLLTICDPDGELPLADDLSAGLARLDRLAQCGQHVMVTR